MPVLQKTLIVLSLVVSATGEFLDSRHRLRLEHRLSQLQELKAFQHQLDRAPGPAPAPFDGDKYIMSGMDEEKPAAEQGFHGDLVEHNDMSTMNEDWQSEHSTHHPCDHCHLYPDNTWCKDMCKKPAARKPAARKPSPVVQPVVKPVVPPPPAEKEEKSMLDKLMDALKDVAKAIWDAVNKAMDVLKDAFGAMGGALAKGAAAVKDFLKDLFGWNSGSFRGSPLLGAGLALLALVASQ